MKIFKITSIFLLTLNLSACWQTLAPVAPKSDPAISVLADVAEDVRKTTRLVGEIHSANNPARASIRASDPALLATVTILDYNGGPVLLLDRVAQRVGYKFHDHSNQSIRFAPISISVKSEKIITVLQDVAAQVGSSADLVLNEADKTIRLVSR